MIVDPLTTGLLWVGFTFLVLIVYLLGRALIRLRFKNWSPKHQWQVFSGISIIVLLPGTVYLEVFQPMGGIYSNEAARYWIGRAAKDNGRSGKESHVARVALSSGYGSHIAMQAIGYVEEKRERCLLRTILAELPKVRNQLERRQEAQQECGRIQKP